MVLTAGSGFHSEHSMRKLLDRKVDVYVADHRFRQRDPRFAGHQEYKKKTTDRKRTSKARKYFSADDFHFDPSGTLLCPAGKPMKSRCPNWRDKSKGYTGRSFMGFEKTCSVCEYPAHAWLGSLYPARQREGRHAVEAILPGAQHRKDCEVCNDIVYN